MSACVPAEVWPWDSARSRAARSDFKVAHDRALRSFPLNAILRIFSSAGAPTLLTVSMASGNGMQIGNTIPVSH